MYQYNNYAYLSGVPSSQNIAAYSTRQSAAAAAASYNPFMSSMATSDADHRRSIDDDAARDPSSRRPTPGGSTSFPDRSSADAVPPPPPTTSTLRDRLTSPSARPALGGFPDGVLYSVPLNRVAVHVDADDNDDETRHLHARSHSAPAATHRLTVQRRSAPSPTMWYAQSTSPRPDVDHCLMMSPPPPAATPAASHDSTTKLRHRRTFPSSNVELNGPVGEGDACNADVRRPNSVNLAPTCSASVASCDPVSTRRRLRATRGRLNLSATSDCNLAGTLVGMAMIAGVALVFSVVGVQLLLRLTAASRRATGHDAATETTNDAGDSLIPATTSNSDDSGRTTITRTVVEEVAVALAAVTVALDLCCLLTLSIQCFLAVKLLHCRNAESRVFGYLDRCSATRMAASAGLFFSIPVFLLALTMYAVLEYSFTSAITCVVVFTVAIVCIAITAAHSIHCWNVEKSQANSPSEQTAKSSPPSLLPHDTSKPTLNTDDSALSHMKLSTLV